MPKQHAYDPQRPHHHHPLSWFLNRAEGLIDVGIVFAIAAILLAVIVSVIMSPGHPSYFDRLPQ